MKERVKRTRQELVKIGVDTVGLMCDLSAVGEDILDFRGQQRRIGTNSFGRRVFVFVVLKDAFADFAHISVRQESGKTAGQSVRHERCAGRRLTFDHLIDQLQIVGRTDRETVDARLFR